MNYNNYQKNVLKYHKKGIHYNSNPLLRYPYSESAKQTHKEWDDISQNIKRILTTYHLRACDKKLIFEMYSGYLSQYTTGNTLYALLLINKMKDKSFSKKKNEKGAKK